MAARKKATRKKATRKKAARPNKKPGKPIARTAAAYRVFLRTYGKIGVMSAAANIAGISISTVRDRMKADPTFGAAVRKARSRIVSRLVDATITAAVTPDAHGRRDTKAGQFMLTNMDPENFKHRREETTFDGGSYESGIAEARRSLTPEEKQELQAMGKKRILQRGTGETS
jgi:hypothetical protein